jgi:hypothetical protein
MVRVLVLLLCLAFVVYAATSLRFCASRNKYTQHDGNVGGYSTSFKQAKKQQQRVLRPLSALPASVASTTVADSGMDQSAIWSGQQNSLKLNPHYARYTLNLPQPTGLMVAYEPLVVHQMQIKADELDQFSWDNDRPFVCVLQHNAVSLRPAYRLVHELRDALSPNHCNEVIAKAETYASANGGWTTSR